MENLYEFERQHSINANIIILEEKIIYNDIFVTLNNRSNNKNIYNHGNKKQYEEYKVKIINGNADVNQNNTYHYTKTKINLLRIEMKMVPSGNNCIQK